MADNFDAIDIIYDFISSIEEPVFKIKPPTNQAGTHVVISTLDCNCLTFLNKIPVNVKIFVETGDHGMVNKEALNTLKNSIQTLLQSGIPPTGIYFNMRQSFIATYVDAKTGFDCVNIRLLLIINS